MPAHGATHIITRHICHVFGTPVLEGLLKHIPRLRFSCVIITTLYQLMLQSWYEKTAQSLVNTLVLFQHGEIFFLLWNFDRQNEMQLLTKFKQIRYMGFRATLKVRKCKVALNLLYRICLNFAKSCISFCLSKFHNKKKIHRAEITRTCLPVIGRFFHTMIVASIDKEW